MTTTVRTDPGSAATPRDDEIVIQADQLPLYCPGPNAPLWSMHPRVFIDIAHTRQAQCPYCSARYRLEGDVRGQY